MAIPSLQLHFRVWVASWNMAAKEHFQVYQKEGIKQIPQSELAKIQQVVPTDYDIYVLGVQECISETLFDIIDVHLQDYNVYRQHIKESRVYGRGDGSFINPKFTGIAIWVKADILADASVSIQRVTSLPLGVLEGSKGGGAVVLQVSGTTIAFICVHMSSNTSKEKQQNYKYLVDQGGSKLGEKHFDLLEQFHHVVWFGDTNYRITSIVTEKVVALMEERKISELWAHDSLLRDLKLAKSFWKFKEPRPQPDFYPTYKKIPDRGFDNPHHRPLEEIQEIYRTKYKEPIYKGGAIHDRCPSFCDRILIHTLKSERRTLSAEIDKTEKEIKCHNYGCIYDNWTGSDHTGVFCGFDVKPYRMLTKTPREMSAEGVAHWYTVTVVAIHASRGQNQEVPHKFRVLFPAPFEDGNDNPQSTLMKKETLDDYITLEHELKQAMEDQAFSHNPEREELIQRIEQEIIIRRKQLTCSWQGKSMRPAECNLHCLFKCFFRDGIVGQGIASLNINEAFSLDPFRKKIICRSMALTSCGLPLICPNTIRDDPKEIQVEVMLEVSIEEH